ncbi:MAG: hypothetical protein ABF979_13510 [Gluconobacter sp.]|uniref:hypothetical protein n=1 Tax=Gluconobacter sp. TaxID=1876758 RepID=UPI0039E90395
MPDCITYRVEASARLLGDTSNGIPSTPQFLDEGELCKRQGFSVSASTLRHHVVDVIGLSS